MVLQAQQPQERLKPGQRLSQTEFHRRYEAMQTDDTFELVNGVVYLKPRNSYPHARLIFFLGGLLTEFELVTPAADGLLNVTLIVSPTCEVQLDLVLRLQPEFGGKSCAVDGFLCGGAELLIEIADKPSPLDVRLKPKEFGRSEIGEYLFLGLRDQEARHFSAKNGWDETRMRDDIWKSATFPGLWLDLTAVFAHDSRKAQQTLKRGLQARRRNRAIPPV
jgi:Uma2 family endonuclease